MPFGWQANIPFERTFRNCCLCPTDAGCTTTALFGIGPGMFEASGKLCVKPMRRQHWGVWRFWAWHSDLVSCGNQANTALRAALPNGRHHPRMIRPARYRTGLIGFAVSFAALIGTQARHYPTGSHLTFAKAFTGPSPFRSGCSDRRWLAVCIAWCFTGAVSAPSGFWQPLEMPVPS